MSEPIFGISITSVDDEPRPVTGADMAIVALVGPAADADVDVFPVNAPVRIFSDEATTTVKLGPGALADAVAGINDQLAAFEVAAQIVIVRVAEGANDNETMTNIIGSSAAKTGIWALTKAGPDLGIVPRLVAVPGFTKQFTQAAPTVTVNSAPKSGGNTGSGVLTLANPAYGSSVKNGVYRIRCTATGTDGGTFSVVDPDNIALANATVGSAYTGDHVKFTIGDGLTDFAIGDGFDITAAVTAGAVTANPVVAALPPVLERLLAHAVVQGPTDSLAHFQAWRETISSQRIIPVGISVKVGADATEQDASGRVLGIGVRRDHENGGRPFHSWANQGVQGIVAPGRSIDFSITDGSTEGQQILAVNGGIIVRGDAGVEGAIAASGFIYIGTDNCSEDELWQFYNVTRGRDYIHLLFLRALRFYLGRFNITIQTVEAIIQTMQLALRDLQANGDILGYKVGFTKALNSPENLRQGKFTVDFQAEEAPVLRKLGIRSARYRAALDTLLDDLAAQLDLVA